MIADHHQQLDQVETFGTSTLISSVGFPTPDFKLRSSDGHRRCRLPERRNSLCPDQSERLVTVP